MLAASQDLIFSDLIHDDRVQMIETNPTGTNRLLFNLKKMHFSKKINSIVNLPFKSIWGQPLDNIDWDENNEKYVIIPHGVLNFLDVSYMLEKRRRGRVKYILYLVDFWQSKYAARARDFEKKLGFDYIFTFDPVDAQKYGFIYHNIPYSILLRNKDKNIETTNDIYFIGWAKDRLSILHDIYLYLNKNGISFNFGICGVKAKDQLKRSEIIYNKVVDYDKTLPDIKQSNCVLEILAGGQSGATLRYYDSICYNKKLLTNNKNVVNLPFYNPDYIHIFEKPEDIDCDWVKERIPVDYHYDGRFSPTHLIDRIIELEEEKEGKTGGPEQTS